MSSSIFHQLEWRSTNATGCHGCHAWSRLGAPEPHGDFQATHRPPRSTAVPCLPLGRLVPPPLAGRAIALFFFGNNYSLFFKIISLLRQEAKARAWASRPRPRPTPRGQGQGRGLGLKAKAKAYAKRPRPGPGPQSQGKGLGIKAKARA